MYNVDKRYSIECRELNVVCLRYNYKTIIGSVALSVSTAIQISKTFAIHVYLYCYVTTLHSLPTSGVVKIRWLLKLQKIIIY